MSREHSNSDLSVAIEPLKTKGNSELIANVIGDTHERIAESHECFRAFIATGAWMPIGHVVTQSFTCGDQNELEDADASL